MKTFDAICYGKKIKLSIQIGHYGNGSIAIRTFDHSNGYAEPWGNLTVNLEGYGLNALDVADYGAYIDVENSDGMFKALVENNFVELTGRALDCGYVKFPEVIFKEEFLKEFDPDNFEEYEAFVEAYKIATNRV